MLIKEEIKAEDAGKLARILLKKVTKEKDEEAEWEI